MPILYNSIKNYAIVGECQDIFPDIKTNLMISKNEDDNDGGHSDDGTEDDSHILKWDVCNPNLWATKLICVMFGLLYRR